MKDTDILLVCNGSTWTQLPAGLATDAEARSRTSTTNALTPANFAARACFSAHKTGADQTGIARLTPTKVTFGSEALDVGGHFDTTNARWMPPPVSSACPL